MSDERQLFLDGSPVTMRQLIGAAKECGYSGHDNFIFLTSEAAEVLREHGHAVECKRSDQTPNV